MDLSDYEQPSLPGIHLPQPPQPSTPRWRWLLVAVALGAALSVVGMNLLQGQKDLINGDIGTVEALQGLPTVASTNSGPVDVGNRVVPSVVTVQVGERSGNGFVTLGYGSGVVIDDEGLIVTNDHVVAAGTDAQVVLADGRVYQAALIGADPSTDLAVLSISATGLPAVAFGSSDQLQVGDAAIAIGSPLGLAGGPSLSVGVISAFGRKVQTSPGSILYGMLQTDAPITQGSSGGALVDEAGRLVGITTAIGVSSVGIEGIGFATPIEIVERVVDDLATTGSASQPYLGIIGATGFSELDDGAQIPTGVEVGSVEPGSAAIQGGLEPGDLVTSVDGIRIDTMDELIAALRRHRAGDRILVSLSRLGVPRDVEVVLGER